MTFTPYTYDSAGHELELNDGDIVATIEGSVSWQEGKYTNEANETVEVTIRHGHARVLAEIHDQTNDSDVQNAICSYVKRELGDLAWQHFCEASEVVP